VEVIIENIIAYGFVFLLFAGIIGFYLRKNLRNSNTTQEKIAKAKELGFHEPVSLHPVVNMDICIGSGACITACPEKDILGIVNAQAFPINASRCVGHGACFNACPVHAISLVIGTEKRGVDLPHVSPEFESNISGIYIAGELGGMGLIKNAVEQGKQAVEVISRKIRRSKNAEYDLLIVGAGPAGLAAPRPVSGASARARHTVSNPRVRRWQFATRAYSDAPFPLTLTLSLREREQRRPRVELSNRARCTR